MDFCKVQQGGNWCDYDCYGEPQLDDRGKLINQIKDNDRIEIKFPDGHVQTTRVKLEKGGYEVSDMGHPWTVPTTTACVNLSIHKTRVRIPLRSMNVKIRKLSR